ncbi:MAG TPA: glycosyl hydrolase 115 family protein [Steroidobacteraceae bacterium]|nr:glycosyl hydrolase 115 family protein [Steroidobacteraceae bacterium]
MAISRRAFVAASSALGISLRTGASLLNSDHDAFVLSASGTTSPILVDRDDFPGVIRAAHDLANDIGRVSGTDAFIINAVDGRSHSLIIVGTLGRSATVDHLVDIGKINVKEVQGKWETYLIQTIEHPLPGVASALVIVGSDKRGTIYGVYEISERIGVSPWYWWADVPVKRQDTVYFEKGRRIQGPPAVKYRGIFLNDEQPCLGGWTTEKFGGMNSQFYTKVFELLLRLRANYLWPAMWDNAFFTDDPDNANLADEYGIVMGTSHHEPMMRAHKEWTEHKADYGNGKWNYVLNKDGLLQFFREGITRNKNFETLVTIGMRGDGDEAMPTTGSLGSDIKLLEHIMADQRVIISEEKQTNAAEVPQLWALFTEVQKYYENGLRVPDDVTLLWTDDNTGNLRRLPTSQERRRSGGAGIYYHFDMHGGPFSYQWINTNPFPKIWEQMNLAHEYGANQIWIANVGDLKPLELPMEFFLRLAWNPAMVTRENIGDYTRRWAMREFGETHAVDIADVVSKYTKYNGWRKPELIAPETFSFTHYREAERVGLLWKDVIERAEKLYQILPQNQKAAFYQLVLHPARASGLVTQMNIAAGLSKFYATQGRASSLLEAQRTRELFKQDQALSDYYNHKLSDGKWDHLMDQTHLGEVTWQPPRVNVMPAISEILPQDTNDYGVAIEGDPNAWPRHYGDAVLPTFDSLNYRQSYVEVFAEGTQPIDFSLEADKPWVVLSEDHDHTPDRRFWVDIDWAKAPEGAATAMIAIKGKQPDVVVKVNTLKASQEQVAEARGHFASLLLPIAFDAKDAAQVTSVNDVAWKLISDYGRVESAMSIFPVTASSILPPDPAPQLIYPVWFPETGRVDVILILGPVMDFVPDRGMRIAVSFDDEVPQVLDIFSNRAAETFLSDAWWSVFTKNNARYLRSTHELLTPGRHQLKIGMVDPGIVVQKIVLANATLPYSYFGPPSQLRMK